MVFHNISMPGRFDHMTCTSSEIPCQETRDLKKRIREQNRRIKKLELELRKIRKGD